MKIVVFDDDPTGSQTVHGCPLLLKWDQSSLSDAIRHPSPLIFLLANTRSMPPDLAAIRTHDICKSVARALRSERFGLDNILFVSRGDSTLRGHGVLEPEVINEVLGPFDATLHVPAFIEGGRTTINGVHLLNGSPVHTTPFAQDKTFGYSTSDLDLWLEEKSRGAILARNVHRLTIHSLEAAFDSKSGMNSLVDWLSDLSGNKPVVVDAELPIHLDVLGKAIRRLLGRKRFLFRSAASLINGLANLPSNCYQPKDLVALRLKAGPGDLKPGLVMVGSYVPLADEQLEILLQNHSCVGIELPVKKILLALQGSLSDLIFSEMKNEWLDRLNHILASKKTPVLYSSRGELQFESAQERINFGNGLASLMASLVAKVSSQLGYVITKGGITSHAFLEKGLKLTSVQLKGQLLPGLSLVCADTYLPAQGLPIVTFPGNLGQKETLSLAWRLMEDAN